jgi:hypothetical protein
MILIEYLDHRLLHQRPLPNNNFPGDQIRWLFRWSFACEIDLGNIIDRVHEKKYKSKLICAQQIFAETPQQTHPMVGSLLPVILQQASFLQI